MKTNQVAPIASAVFVLLVMTLACSGGAAPDSMAVPPTESPVPTATQTQVPTSTPKPTATPNLSATQEAEETLSRVQSYVDMGYLNSTDGMLVKLDDYKRDMALIDYLTFDWAGWNAPVKDFAAWADVKWESAAPVGPPQLAGCGFSFRIHQENYEGYTALLTNERVYLTYCDSTINGCGEIGKTRGSGRLQFGNPAEAFMELIVNDSRAYVLVDGEFIGEYSLFKDKLIEPDIFMYSIISGTNHDYGVHCEITNSRLWIVK